MSIDNHPLENSEQKITKNTIIAIIGDFPLLSARYQADFPRGDIVLKYGHHVKQNNGFGYVHILAEHKADLDKYHLPHNLEGVATYIQKIIRSGAGIYTEFFISKGKYIPTIFWSKMGIVVMQREELPNGINRYSIVTAYGRQNPIGQKIGSIPSRINLSTHKKTP